MELNLSLPELEAILEAARKREHERNKFAAALKGVKLDDPGEEALPTGDEIRLRAEAKRLGVSEEQLTFAEVGIEIQEG